MHVVESREAPAPQQFIGQDVGYRFNPPENIWPGAECAFKKDHCAFRRIRVSAVQIPEANRNRSRRDPTAFRRIWQWPIRKQEMEIPAVGTRDHGDAFRKPEEQRLFSIRFTMWADIEVSKFGLGRL